MDVNHQIEVFYDGDCPLCMREINFLKRRKRSNLIRFTDISQPNFKAAEYDLSLIHI